MGSEQGRGREPGSSGRGRESGSSVSSFDLDLPGIGRFAFRGKHAGWFLAIAIVMLVLLFVITKMESPLQSGIPSPTVVPVPPTHSGEEEGVGPQGRIGGEVPGPGYVPWLLPPTLGSPQGGTGGGEGPGKDRLPLPAPGGPQTGTSVPGVVPGERGGAPTEGRHGEGGEVISTSVAPPIDTFREPASCSGNLLTSPWHLEASRDHDEEQEYFAADTNLLAEKNMVLVTYNLHGLRAQEGPRHDQSALVFDQPTEAGTWYVVSFEDYGTNGSADWQTVKIPLADFKGLSDSPPGQLNGRTLDTARPVSVMHTRFWNDAPYVVDISSIKLCNGPSLPG